MNRPTIRGVGLALAVILFGGGASRAEGPFKLVPRGVEVTEVVRGWPAWRAGLEVGDVIVEIDGRTIRDCEDLQLALRRVRAVRITVIDGRTGKRQTIRVFPVRGKIGIDARPVDLEDSPLGSSKGASSQ